MELFGDPSMLAVMAFAFGVAAAAGLVKGMVGFGMPMIMISLLSSFVPAETALAWLILPTLVTNGWQALRQGLGVAWQSIRRFRVFLITCLLLMMTVAQFVRLMPNAVFLLVIGVPVTVFAATSLMGIPLRLPSNPSRRVEVFTGMVAGFFGGISGVWGPPTVALLTAFNTPKTEQMRVQGVVYGLGAMTLFGSHLTSGVLNAQTLPMSLALTVPGLMGIWIGFRIQDRIDQDTFRKLTLVVLLIGGLNLIRRGVVGL